MGEFWAQSSDSLGKSFPLKSKILMLSILFVIVNYFFKYRIVAIVYFPTGLI